MVLSGLGVAAFHPEGSRFANYVSGARRASGMSLFSVGGNVGFALGPVLVTPLVLAFGLHGTLFVLIPTWLASAGAGARAAAAEAIPHATSSADACSRASTTRRGGRSRCSPA